MPEMGARLVARIRVMTTTERDALEAVEGMVIFNSTTDQLEEYDGTQWQAVGQVIMDTHEADADAHHSEEIPEGRGYYNTTTLLSVPGIGMYGGTGMDLTANYIYYFPIHIRTPITIDQVTIEIYGAAASGKKARFGIYAADTDWQPGALQVASAEFAIDANAVVNTALTETTLQEGRYLMAITPEATASWRVVKSANAYGFLNSVLGGNPLIGLLRVSAAYAALPDPGTAWDTTGAVDTGFFYPAFLRVKTP